MMLSADTEKTFIVLFLSVDFLNNEIQKSELFFQVSRLFSFEIFWTLEKLKSNNIEK